MKQYTPPTPRQVLQRARAGGYAVGAFNVSTDVVLKAIVQAAAKLRAPVIIETSSGETAFVGARLQAAVVHAYEQQARLPLLMNLDHAKTYAEVRTAMEAGYAMLHFDGSELSKKTNVRILKRVVHEAHARRLLVEGERDHITGSSEWHPGTKMEKELRKGMLTDPDEAAAFVQQTGVDIFAPFIGNIHGVFQNKERLDFRLLQTLSSTLPCFLSLHGGSGIHAQHIRRAIGMGIVKINVNTDLRIAYLLALRATLKKHPREAAPYKILPPVVAAVQKVVEEKIRLFGSAGQA
ncbi:MAG: class II fructose-bisphosphate aldolase [bacterium]